MRKTSTSPETNGGWFGFFKLAKKYAVKYGICIFQRSKNCVDGNTKPTACMSSSKKAFGTAESVILVKLKVLA